MIPMNLRRAVLTVLALLAGVPAMTPDAGAQEVVAISSRAVNVGGAGEGQIARSSALRYADLLGLDEAQREVVDVLFDGYSTSYQDARQRMVSDMERVQGEFRDSQDFTIVSERMPEIMRTFREHSESLERQFFDDLRAVLSEEQTPRMEAVERMRRRETQLGFNVSGANVDLADLVHDLELELSEEGADALVAYELDLDRMLQENQRGEFQLAGAEIEEIQEALAETHERGLRVRDINRRHARGLAAILGEEDRARFDRALRERSFPRVYRTPHAMQMLEAAQGFTDLGPAQREQLDVLHRGYERDLERANERWASEIEKADDEGFNGGSMVHGSGDSFVMLSMHGGEPTPVDEARDARRELDKRIEKKLEELLSEEQIARLPARGDEAQTAVFWPGGGSQRMIIRGG